MVVDGFSAISCIFFNSTHFSMQSQVIAFKKHRQARYMISKSILYSFYISITQKTVHILFNMVLSPKIRIRKADYLTRMTSHFFGPFPFLQTNQLLLPYLCAWLYHTRTGNSVKYT